MSAFCLVDDKHVPLYRILWVSELPHFCGSDDCQQEGDTKFVWTRGIGLGQLRGAGRRAGRHRGLATRCRPPE